MNIPFFNKLVYYDWLVKNIDLIEDVKNIIKNNLYFVLKRREFKPPCYKDVIKYKKHVLFNYNDIRVSIEKDFNRYNNRCIVDYNNIIIIYVYQDDIILKVYFDDFVDNFKVNSNQIYKHTIDCYMYDLNTTISFY